MFSCIYFRYDCFKVCLVYLTNPIQKAGRISADRELPNVELQM